MGSAVELVGFAVGVLLLGWAVKTAMELWWTPRKLEKEIRAAGIDGTSYSLCFSDLRETLRLSKEAKSKPMPISHNIVSRVVPFPWQIVKTYGKVTLNWLGTSPRIIISDPVLIREVLVNKSGHIGKPQIRRPGSYIVSGLVGLDGDKWATHRKIVSPAFLLEKLKRMQPAFSMCCVELVRRWDSLLGPDGSCELDVWPELQNFTRDVISRAAFGSSSEEGRRIFQLQDEQAQLVAESFLYFQIPCYRFLPTRFNRRMRQIDVELKALLRGIIAKREKETRQSAAGQVPDDLLGLLLQANQAQSRMTTEDVINECKLFYFAGQETTSILLTWTMVALGMNPLWQDRARAEVLQVFGREKPDFDRLSQLKIVTMILYEVLRLYPAVVFLSRRTKAATKIGEYSLPAGLQLQLSVLLLQHDPEYWGEDANEFKPERFAEGVSRAAKDQSPEAVAPFFAFGGGARICVGQGFAMLEAKMGLASILQRFSFDLSPAYTHAPYTVLTLQPQHGAQLILRRT